MIKIIFAIYMIKITFAIYIYLLVLFVLFTVLHFSISDYRVDSGSDYCIEKKNMGNARLYFHRQVSLWQKFLSVLMVRFARA